MLSLLYLAVKLPYYSSKPWHAGVMCMNFFRTIPSVSWSEYHEQRTKKQQRKQEKTSAESERKEGGEEVQERV
jgi:hypothetical protein